LPAAMRRRRVRRKHLADELMKRVNICQLHMHRGMVALAAMYDVASREEHSADEQR
jgi:hypothetical protein